MRTHHAGPSFARQRDFSRSFVLPTIRTPLMSCKGTLVVESDADGKLVKWELRCEGKCKDKKQDCGTRVLDAGVLMYYCACNEDQEDEEGPKCRFQVYVSRKQPIRTWAKCVGRCGKEKKE